MGAVLAPWKRGMCDVKPHHHHHHHHHLCGTHQIHMSTWSSTCLLVWINWYDGMFVYFLSIASILFLVVFGSWANWQSTCKHIFYSSCHSNMVDVTAYNCHILWKTVKNKVNLRRQKQFLNIWVPTGDDAEEKSNIRIKKAETVTANRCRHCKDNKTV